jgi:tetratricopeptide (TPR) repeat protein
VSRRVHTRRWFVLLVPVVALAALGGEARGQEKSERKYPFPRSPLEIHDRLVKDGLDTADALPAADRKFLADLWAARVAKKSLAQADDAAVTAHLIASGVHDPMARAAYLKKFNALVAAAEKAVAGSKTDAEKADRLLRFLHTGAMAKGYAEKQTTLSGVCDTGQFNCVSSSSVYFLVGTRLGLKLQPVLIPGTSYSAGHAAVDLLDGTKRVEIEPTNPDGFDWPAKLKRPGVVAIGPQPDRMKAYDCDGFGLAASIASNLGVAAGKADPPRPAEAVRRGLVALALDPADRSAAENLVAAVSNWGLALDKEKKFEEAIKIYEFGRDSLGKHKTLDHNYKVAWEHRLGALFGGGRFADGLKLLPAAAAAFPDDRKLADPAEWVARAGSRKAEDEGWEKALALADAALEEFKGRPADDVRKWKDKARRWWSQDLLEKGNVDGSFKVIAAGLAESPASTELVAGLGTHTREALKYLDEKKGPTAAAEHFRDVVKAFPKEKKVRDTGFAHAALAVQKLTDDKKFAEALEAAVAYAPLAGDRAAELKARAFDDWGQALAKDGQWEDAIKKYAEGLAAAPKVKRLRDNAIATVDQWGFPLIKEKKWAAAIERYELALKLLGDQKELKERVEYCKKQRGDS